MTQPRISHGKSSLPLSVGRYRLTEAHYSADQSVGRHEHAFPSWTLLLSGSFEETFSGSALVCLPGMVLSKPSSADHSNRYGSAGAHCLLIECREVGPPASQLTPDLFLTPRSFRDGVFPTIAGNIYREFIGRDRRNTLSLEGLLVELATATARRLKPYRASSKVWLNHVRDRLETEFRSPPSLTELAADHDVHPAYLCQQFRAVFGFSVGEFTRQTRFEWARACLKMSDSPLSEIACVAGYSDQSHFSRDFMRREATSPRRFRLAQSAWLRRVGYLQRTSRQS